MTQDEKWMQIAILEARKADNESEIPVGAIMIKDGNIIARAHNQPILKNDATAHAEIQVIRAAGKELKNYRLNDCSLFVTLEPCAMCFGASVHARIKRIVYGARDPKTGVCSSSENLIDAKFFTHKIKVDGGILERECSQLLKKFFKLRR